MTTRKLLWGMTWRGGVWSAKAGVLSLLTLAILNFVILALHPCLLNKTCNQRDYIFQFGDMGFMMALMTPFVLGINCLLFWILGAFNGAILWFTAKRYWVRQRNRFRFSRFIAIIGVLLGLAEALASYQLLRDIIFVLDFHLIWIWEDILPREATSLLHAIIWVSIYTFCALHVSQRLARWYESSAVTKTTLDIQPESKTVERKWLWRMTWYGLGSVLFYGLVFTIGYSAILFASYLLSGKFAFLKSLDSQIHFYSISMIASLASLIGIVVNSVSGFLAGFILGLFADKYIYSVVHPSRHRRMARTISILVGIVCSGLGYGLMFQILLRGWKVPMDLQVVAFGIAIPSILTVITVWFCTLQITKSCERESAKGIAQNVSSN